MTASQSARPLVERRTIDVIPPEERHGTPANQLTLWMGANLQITAIVDGALAVVFGADALWAILGLLLGNLAGGVVMALHSAQGPRLGLPQMISSRAQFGVYGAVIPLCLVILMYLGFTATGIVLAGQAINALLHVEATWIGIVLFAAIVSVIAVVGYNLIHSVGRVATVLGVLGFGYLAVELVRQHDVSAAFASPRYFSINSLAPERIVSCIPAKYSSAPMRRPVTTTPAQQRVRRWAESVCGPRLSAKSTMSVRSGSLEGGESLFA